jgi:hypothetical protein
MHMVISHSFAFWLILQFLFLPVGVMFSLQSLLVYIKSKLVWVLDNYLQFFSKRKAENLLQGGVRRADDSGSAWEQINLRWCSKPSQLNFSQSLGLTYTNEWRHVMLYRSK